MIETIKVDYPDEFVIDIEPEDGIPELIVDNSELKSEDVIIFMVLVNHGEYSLLGKFKYNKEIYRMIKLVQIDGKLLLDSYIR
ncbi:MAG: hypothetical protein KC414_05630 [Romboutsia sp.]|nr:hypothetical protein [Romboutsia sp.]